MAGVEERMKLLLDDPDLSIVEAHRVFCNRCDKWLKLDEAKLYAASVWRCHKNTKSHNARPPKVSTAIQLPKGDQLTGPSNHKNASASVSLPSQSKESSLKASSTRRALPGDQSRLRSSDLPSSASAPVPRSLPRLKLKMPVSARSDTTPTSASTSGAVPPAHRSSLVSNGAARTLTASPLSTISKHRTGANGQSAVPSQPASSQSGSPQRSMPPPALSPSTQKVSAHLSTQSELSVTLSQPSNLLQTPIASKSISRIRSTSFSVKDGEASPASASASRAPLPSPERLSPHRKASYKALVAESYIGKLEPFRAFCTLCNRWVDLSSRTPYSYGVWKGHIRKTDKHNRLQASNAEDDYDTTSENSHEESGAPPASENEAVAPRKAEAIEINGQLVSSTLASSLASDPTRVAGKKTKDRSSGTSPIENGHLQQSDAVLTMEPCLGAALASGEGGPATFNPFALKATTEDSFSPRHHLETGDPLESKGSQVSLLEGDDMPLLTESSEEEPSSSQVPQKSSARLALERRRDGMLADPDAVIVESRRVKCGLCDRWIKGSNTQEYSSHHWLKHKKKCSRTKALQTERFSEPAEARKARLEADPDLETLEPHRALCRLCNKWVKLCGRSRYSASHWLQHKKKCLALQSKSDVLAKLEAMEASTSSLSGNDKRSSSKVPSPGSSPESRRAALLADPDVLQLLPDRVQCRPCNRWIKLAMPVEYSPSHWLNHKECCPGQASDSTSKLQAALETRKNTLEGDPDVIELEPHRVRCRMCSLWVKLRQDCSYSLGKWETHKKRCGHQTRGRQMDVGLEAEEADNESDELIEDDREAMDVEYALKGELEDQKDDKRLDLLSQTEAAATSPAPVRSQTPNEADAMSNGVQGPPSCDCDDHADKDIEMADDQPDALAELTYPDSDGSPVSNTQGEGDDDGEGRRMQLMRDVDVLEADSQRVMCRRCRSWVGLDGPDLYMVGNWLKHKESCRGQITHVNMPTQDAAAHRPVSQRLSKQPTGLHAKTLASRPVRPLPKGKGKAAGHRRAPSPMTLPPLPLRPRWPGEDERKQQFVDDPDVLRIEPHRLLCRHCNCWIRLHPIIRYCQSVWPRHKESCRDVQAVVPGDAKIRAKSEKEDARRQLLEEDPYATDIGPHRVMCKACGTNIRLDTTYKYEGSHWRAHRSRCGRIPFQSRLPKKRKATELARRSRDTLPHHQLESPSQAQGPVAMTDSSDSDDSDASSAPRPRPTSFFTAPLELNPTEMFKRRSRANGSSITSSAAAAKAQFEAVLAARLQVIAAELDVSDRLIAIIELAGDGVTTEERLARDQKQETTAAQAENSDPDLMQHEEAPLVTQPPPTPDPETWIPRKRTREEEAEFDAFFSGRPRSPTPPRSKAKLRVCKLGKEAMQVVD